MYKIAALDIDGTLLDEYSNLSKRTKKTIRKLQRTGILVTLCTGRNFSNTLPIARDLGIKTPIICSDGIFIYDIENKMVMRERLLKKDELEAMVSIAKKRDAYIEIVTSNNYYKYIKNIEMRKFDFVKDFSLYKRFLNYRCGIRYIKDFLDDFYDQVRCHVLIIGAEPDVLEEIKLKIEELKYDHLILQDNLWEGYIFIHYRETSKGYGISFLCEKLNISLEEVVGIGNDYNDISMFKEIGMPIAMGDAVDEVKIHAKEITKTVLEDGAAIALEKHFNL